GGLEALCSGCTPSRPLGLEEWTQKYQREIYDSLVPGIISVGLHNFAEVSMKRNSLRDIILTLAAGGLEILERTSGRHHGDIVMMCKRLLQLKGEASAITLANQILTAYKELSDRNRLQFFERLLTEFVPDA